MRAALKELELSATAFEISVSSTNSETKVCRAGASNAAVQPWPSANTYTCHNFTPAQQRQRTQPARQQRHRALRNEQELAAVEAISSVARERDQHGRRPELQRHHGTERGRAVARQLGQHKPILRRALHPRANVGHQRSERPKPVVEARERPEGTVAKLAHDS